MIELIAVFLAGGAATGLAVLPYAIRRDRNWTELVVEHEEQAHELANAQAQARNAEQQVVDAAVRRVEDAAVIRRLDGMIEALQAEVASLMDKLRIQSLDAKTPRSPI